MEVEKSTITIIDDDGRERECQVLFTYQNPETGLEYVVLYPEEDLDDDSDDALDVYAYRYVTDETGMNGELFALESDEEIEMINEVIDSFYKDNFAEDEEE